MLLMWILGFALLGSLGAIAGAAAFLLCPKECRERLVPFLVSYATGTLLGASLLGLLPQAIELGGLLSSLGAVLAGLIGFFILERFMIWRHCHVEGTCEVHGTAGYLLLAGDALHNFVDGAVMRGRIHVVGAAWRGNGDCGDCARIATGSGRFCHSPRERVYEDARAQMEPHFR